MNNTTPAPPSTPATPESTNPIVRLLKSSKALVVLVVTGLCFAAVFTHNATWDQATEFLKWVIGPWLVAQGAEDALGKYAASKAASTTVVNMGGQ